VAWASAARTDDASAALRHHPSFSAKEKGQAIACPFSFVAQAAQESSGFDAEPQRGVSERNRPQGGTWRGDIPPSFSLRLPPTKFFPFGRRVV